MNAETLRRSIANLTASLALTMDEVLRDFSAQIAFVTGEGQTAPRPAAELMACTGPPDFHRFVEAMTYYFAQESVRRRYLAMLDEPGR